ncbi:unnamed protein product [Penicillium camemberti]|uniref:Str. FM013 n=1 Tax=Penicillium camemberti (strain FM 013) TaxID=1429867 RepID=A0A0G4PWK1_PENC3|nr:unnamed protein product [Penicillium camemberti]
MKGAPSKASSSSLFRCREKVPGCLARMARAPISQKNRVVYKQYLFVRFVRNTQGTHIGTDYSHGIGYANATSQGGNAELQFGLIKPTEPIIPGRQVPRPHVSSPESLDFIA